MRRPGDRQWFDGQGDAVPDALVGVAETAADEPVTYLRPIGGEEPERIAEETEAGQVIHFYFPVEVVIVGTLSEPQVDQLRDRIFTELDSALQSQA